MKKLLTLIALITISLQASAWSKFGHEIVVEVAKRHLTERTKANLAKYLPYDITLDAVWMDDHRKDDVIAYTTAWHVYELDDNLEYNINPRLKKGGDAIHALKVADFNLSRYREKCDSTVIFNTRMVLHFVGDMHCPSHAYIGGRCFWDCELDGWKTQFHYIYDKMPALLNPDKTPAQVAAEIDNCKKGEIKRIQSGDLYEWVKHSAVNVKKAYDLNPRGKYHLDPNTVELSRGFVTEQLRNAGYRLAFLLNKYFGE